MKSKKTGMLRNVILNGTHILSLRAREGLFTLKLEGGSLLKDNIPAPALRVMVDEDSAKFNLQGRNVFSQFIIGVDEELRPGDEVLVVNGSDELVTIGRMVLTPWEIPFMKGGVAVKVREGMQVSSKE